MREPPAQKMWFPFVPLEFLELCKTFQFLFRETSRVPPPKTPSLDPLKYFFVAFFFEQCFGGFLPRIPTRLPGWAPLPTTPAPGEDLLCNVGKLRAVFDGMAGVHAGAVSRRQIRNKLTLPLKSHTSELENTGFSLSVSFRAKCSALRACLSGPPGQRDKESVADCWAIQSIVS